MRKRYVILGMSVFLALALAVPALGGPSNPVASISANAKKTAKKALKKAKKAQAAANQAQGTADDAGSAAAAAQAAADAAQTSANNAQSTADTAQLSADAKFADIQARGGDTVGPNSNSPKQVVAACQAGERPTGGGWFTSGVGSDNIAGPQFNAAYLGGWIVNLEEIEGGTAGNWAATAQVECAQRVPGPVAP